MSEPDFEPPIDRTLIERARPALGPSAEQKRRLRQAVLATVAGTAAAGTATVASSGTSGFASLSAGVKVGLMIALAGVVGSAAWFGWRDVSSDSDRPATARDAPRAQETDVVETRAVETRAVETVAVETRAVETVAVETVAVETVAVETMAVETMAVETGAVETAEGWSMDGRASSDARRVSRSPDLERETDLIRRAHEAVRGGDPRSAMRWLDRHAREFPRGVLAPERRLLRALTLCDLGDLAAARTAAGDVLANHPPPAHRERIERSCVGSVAP